MRLHLKTKLKTLAAEASIIKAIEKKKIKRNIEAARKTRADLHNHRVNVVRKECRDSHLAYGFLRGREYADMEDFCYESPRWDNVERIALKFGKDFIETRELNQSFQRWKDEAVAYIRDTHYGIMW